MSPKLFSVRLLPKILSILLALILCQLISSYAVVRINKTKHRRIWADRIDESAIDLDNEGTLDLPVFIQNTNKLTVEVVKGLLSLIYANRNYARSLIVLVAH
jgi:hypothetical protein